MDSLETQTFKDFEIVVTDDSEGNELADLCDDYNVRYLRNPGMRGMASNSNFAIKQAKGDLVKILYQDDYLAHDQALQTIIDNFGDNDYWLITACSNNLNPHYSNQNTLGSPSVLTMRNGLDIWFNEDLKWVLDLDFYKRFFEKYGLPKIINDVNVFIGLGSHQETQHLSNEIKQAEEHTSFKTNSK